MESKNTLRNRNQDWVGQWFELMKNDSENTKILFGHIPSNEIGPFSPQWQEVEHADRDGIAGFVSLCTKESLEVRHLKNIAPDKLPSLLSSLHYFFKRREFISAVGMRWNQKTSLSYGTEGLWSVSIPIKTREMLEAKAKLAKVSLNSWLLTSLNKAIEPLIVDKNQRRHWMIPIDMRSMLELDPTFESIPTAKNSSPSESGTGPSESSFGPSVQLQQNLSSFISCALDAASSPETVHSTIKVNLSQGHHWHNWRTLNIGKFIGRRAVARLYRAEFGKQQWTGVFSNLGKWKLQDSGKYFFVPPNSTYCPISTGAIEVNGTLGLTVRVHGSWTHAQAVAVSLAQEWEALLLQKNSNEKVANSNNPLANSDNTLTNSNDKLTNSNNPLANSSNEVTT